jgi:hypothetical protein
MFGDFFFFVIQNLSLKPPSPNRSENKKDNCSNLVIWTSNMTNIRIQKLFIIGNYCLFISQIKKQQKMSV